MCLRGLFLEIDAILQFGAIASRPARFVASRSRLDAHALMVTRVFYLAAVYVNVLPLYVTFSR